jgi:hypothetical protein
VLSVFGLLAVVLSVILALRCFPKRSLWLVLAIVVPLVGVTVLHFELPLNSNGPDSAYSSIASNLQEYPLRMFPAMLYSVFGIGSLVALMENSVRKVSLISLGLLAGLMIWNSQDVGVAVVCAYFVVLLIATRGANRRRGTAFWICGLVPGLVLYPIWTALMGHPVHLIYLGLAARSYATGFGALLMQVPGPVLLVLPVLLGSAAVGVSLLWKAPNSTSTRSRRKLYAMATLAFIGAWSVGSLPYYVNRSSAYGQLQVFLLPFAVCCCALLSLCLPETSGRMNFRLDVVEYWKKKALLLMPVTLSIAVGIAAILQMPSASAALDRLIHPPSSIGFFASLKSEAIPSKEIAVAKAYAKNHGGGVVGYFGPDADYLALADNLEPRVLFDSPWLFQYSRTALRLGCDYVRHEPSRWLIVAPGSTSYVGANICGVYEPLFVPGLTRGTLFKLQNS